MKKKSFTFCFFNVLIALLFQTLHAQDTSPYWSLAGNKNATTSSKFGTTNNVPLLIFTKNKERLRIDASGNVGIGTKNPSYKLHVEGGSSFAAVYGNDSLGYGVYGTGGVYGVYGNGNDGVFGWSNSGHYGVYGLSDNSFSTTGSAGVYGNGYYGAEGVGTVGVKGMGTAMGVYGYATDNSSFGVYGFSSNFGVYGVGTQCGVYATVGNNGAFAGFFDGNVYSTGNYFTSDSILKKSVTDFTSAIDIINKLQPKFYEFRHDGNYKLMNLPEGKHYGLIAQDIERILPGLVKDTKFDTRFAAQQTTSTGALNDKASDQTQFEVIDFKAVNYTELIPILIKGMQEQQAQIEELKNDINTLKQNDTHTTTRLGFLNQSIPNPTNGIAHISYGLPANSVHAELIITDMAGKIIKVISLNNSGSVDINTTSLSSGVYNYSLQINSKMVDTKKLIVAR